MTSRWFCSDEHVVVSRCARRRTHFFDGDGVGIDASEVPHGIDFSAFDRCGADGGSRDARMARADDAAPERTLH